MGPHSLMATSEARRIANARNAQHSTGPKSEAGKKRSSMNALKHGLTAAEAVLPNEDPAAYQEKLDLLVRLRPAPPTPPTPPSSSAAVIADRKLDRCNRVGNQRLRNRCATRSTSTTSKGRPRPRRSAAD